MQVFCAKLRLQVLRFDVGVNIITTVIVPKGYGMRSSSLFVIIQARKGPPPVLVLEYWIYGFFCWASDSWRDGPRLMGIGLLRVT